MKVIQRFGGTAAKSELRLSLCDLNSDMASAWLECFFGIDSVEIVNGSLMNSRADAVVSPANSFGDMSGGVDKHIDDFYSGEAQRAIMARIREEYLGELPVGMALIVPMSNAPIPYVIAAPTMRVPQQVPNSLNAYLAMRAVLVAALRHNAESERKIRTIAVPGLCTGVGGMAFSAGARQMCAAYDNVIGDGWKQVLHPVMAPFAFSNERTGWPRKP